MSCRRNIASLTGRESTGRITTLLTFVALVLVTTSVGCSPENSPSERFPSGGAASENGTRDPVVVAAGDIADCTSRGDEATATLLRNIEGTVLTLGDNAYEDGTREEFADCYDPSWGRYKDRTYPSPGNHDYETEGAEGYFNYFGDAAGDPSKGYYSFDLGNWHLVALNSNCEEFGDCDSSSPQVRWLEADLARYSKSCTLAYFHYPLFTSGEYRPGISQVKPFWDVLYAAGVDVMLNGHDHNYQRFAPQNPYGEADPERGIREYVVGTGGSSHYNIVVALPNSEVYNDDSYGVLKLILRPQGYDWRFIPVEGTNFTDSGNAKCH